jgi:hypothetical protein
MATVMARNDDVEITVEIVKETDMAYLVKDGDVEVWLPKSQIRGEEDLQGGIVELIIPEWLAEEKDLI